MPKRINDTDLRKQQILQSARTVFLEKGFYGATIDDIAKEVGVVRGTILHYYKSKELLMAAVLENVGREFNPALASIVAAHEISVKERIDKIFELCEVHFVNAKPEVNRYMGNQEEFRFFMDQLRLKIFYRQTEGLTALLEEGVEKGEIAVENPKARAAAVAFAIFGITGAEISTDELRAELREIRESLLASCKM